MSHHRPVSPCSLAEALALAITTLSLSAGAWGQQIRWRSVEAAPRPPVISAQAARALGELIGPAEVRHVAVQFAQPIDKDVRARLSAAGVELPDYLDDNALFAAADRDGIDVPGVGRVRSLKLVHAIERNVKLHPILARGEVPAWAVVGEVIRQGTPEPEPVVGVYVLFHRDVPQDDAVQLARHHGAEIRARLQSVNGLVIELPVSRLDALADADAVQRIEPPLTELSETNNGCREAVQANDAHDPPYNRTMKEWLSKNWHEPTATIFAIIIAALVGYFSGILAMNRELKKLGQRLTAVETSNDIAKETKAIVERELDARGMKARGATRRRRRKPRHTRSVSTPRRASKPLRPRRRRQ